MVYVEGTTKNGTFINAIEECGEKLDSNLDNSWTPVFYPTLNRIKS